MRIAIINLTGGGMSGGYRKYLRNIIPLISKHPNVDAILCASPASIDIKEWFEPLTNVKFISCRPYSFFGYITDLKLNQQVKEFSPDVVFVPIERYFQFNGAPVVRMVQNMGPFVTSIYGGRFHERLKNRIHALDSKRSIRASDRVIAISKYVRDFLVNECRFPDENIGLIYYGIDPPAAEYAYRPDIIPQGWDGHFLFTAGSIVQYRGLEDILYALDHLTGKPVDISGVVIAGETAPGMKKYRKRLETWIRVHELASRVCWTGSLSEKEMAWCYLNCQAFVMTSRVESFGMIAGEAMAHGCVCIAADNPCLPEIFGDNAIYYKPGDYRALAGAIQTIFSWDISQRNKVTERIKKRAVQFSWDVAAERTVVELMKAVQDFGSRNLK